MLGVTPSCQNSHVCQPEVALAKVHSTGGSDGSETHNSRHGLLCPAKRRHNLFVGLCRQESVLPRVDGNLVAGQVLVLEDLRARDGSRANDEEGRGEVVVVEVLEEARRVGRRSVIVRETPGVLRWALDDVGWGECRC